MTFTTEPMAHWITMFNNTQSYKPLPLTRAQTTIRPTNWPFSQRLSSRYELCDCNMFSENAEHRSYMLEFLHTTFTENRCVEITNQRRPFYTVTFQPHIHRSSIPITSALPTAAAAAAGCYIKTPNKSACHQRRFSAPQRVTHIINRHSFRLPIHQT